MQSGKNLKQVLVAHGKLTFKHVIGGVKLVETDFTIKDEKMITNISRLKINEKIQNKNKEEFENGN